MTIGLQIILKYPLPDPIRHIEVSDAIVDRISLCLQFLHRGRQFRISGLLLHTLGKLIDKAAHILQFRQQGQDFFIGPVPPLDLLQLVDDFLRKSILDNARRIPHDDGVGRHILRHDSPRSNDGTVADAHAAHQHHIAANPNIVADDDLIAVDSLGKIQGIPIDLQHIIERICRDAAIVVIESHLENKPMSQSAISTDQNVAVTISIFHAGAYQIRTRPYRHKPVLLTLIFKDPSLYRRKALHLNILYHFPVTTSFASLSISHSLVLCKDCRQRLKRVSCSLHTRAALFRALCLTVKSFASPAARCRI